MDKAYEFWIYITCCMNSERIFKTYDKSYWLHLKLLNSSFHNILDKQTREEYVLLLEPCTADEEFSSHAINTVYDYFMRILESCFVGYVDCTILLKIWSSYSSISVGIMQVNYTKRKMLIYILCTIH